jgi:ABC-2 type transport system ATP-binding protein
MIEIRNLSYRYNKKKQLFNGLSIDIPPGKINGLLGKNGAGKSSLMKNIAGLLFPSEGKCMVNGFTPGKRETSFLQQFFFIPEECYLPPLSIMNFIKVYGSFYPGFDEQQYLQYLKEFDIDTTKNLNALSFGQKKKTYIAFALATNARYLVMDEPTNGLDIPSKLQFRNIMNSALKKDSTIIISTHQVRDLDDMIDSVIILDNSEILLYEDKDTIAAKLFFGIADKTIPESNILYSESTPNGVISVVKGMQGKPSYMDIEILFNAVLNKRELIAGALLTN